MTSSADNTSITPGSGQVIRTDDVNGVKFQVVKIDVGPPGTSQQAQGSVPVTVVSEPAQSAPGTGAPAVVSVVGGSDGAHIQTVSTDTSGRINVNVNGTTTVAGTGNFNSQDVSHVNTGAPLYGAAVRIAAPLAVTQTNKFYRGIMLFLNITQAPTGFGETLTTNISVVDPVTNNTAPITNFSATPAANSGSFASLPKVFVYQLYPGISNPSGISTMQSQSGVLPFMWQATVSHSGSNGWTYSLGAILMY